MFSKRFNTFQAWLAAQTRKTEYVVRITRLHARYSGATLSQLRRHPGKLLKPLGQLKAASRTKLAASVLSAREAEAQSKALKLASLMRTEKITYSAALKRVGLSHGTARRILGTSLRRRAGKIVVSKADIIPREMLMLDEHGVFEVTVRSSREASKIGRYWAALYKWKNGRPRDNNLLKPFETMNVIDEHGRVHKFLTDPKALESIFRSREARFESVYSYAKA